MILTECDLLKALKKEYYNCFLSSMTNDEMRDHIDNWLNDKLYTSNNNARYRKGFIRTILPFRWLVVDELKREFTVFGYWFEGEFYTTYKARHELTRKYKLKTTELLHDKKLPQSIWDSLTRGEYYASNKKVYFKSE